MREKRERRRERKREERKKERRRESERREREREVQCTDRKVEGFEYTDELNEVSHVHYKRFFEKVIFVSGSL